MVKHFTIGFAVLFTALAATGEARRGRLTRFEFEEPHMGTKFRIVLYAPDETVAKKAARAAFDRIEDLNRIMSDYLSTSELMQLCKKAGGDAVSVSRELFDVLVKAEEMAKKTDGAFDVTIGPVVRLWRKARRTGQMPAPEELAKALKLVGHGNIHLDSKMRTVQLLLAGMLLDLGGIAKGYAAEAALEVLRQHGLRRALVAAGGDIVVGDAPPDAPAWKVGIAPMKDPTAPPTHYLRLANAAVSTSGDSHQYVEINGKRYSHIMDPKTGLALTGRRSVSIIAPSGALADALATAMCVMGAERGLPIIEATDGAAALFVMESEKGEITTRSKRFTQHEWKSK